MINELNIIAELTVIDEKYHAKSEVIDALLDVRIAAADSPEVISKIDEALAQVPGKSLTEITWVTEVVDSIKPEAVPDDLSELATPIGA